MLRSVLAPAAAAAALALPASAGAATYTVDPASSGCAQSGTACRTLGEAAARAQDGDTVTVVAGRFAEPPVTFDQDDLVLTGAGSTRTTLTATTPGATLSLTGTRARVSGLAVLREPGGDDGNQALRATGSLTLTDAAAVSATGPAIVLTGGTPTDPSVLIRVAAHALAPDADAIRIDSASGTPAKAVALADVIATGGTSAAGIAVRTLGGVPFSTAGDVTLQASHVTTAGQARGIVLDASQATGDPGLPAVGTPSPAGSITANVADSIVHGPSEARQATASPTAAGNDVRLTFRRTDAPPATGNGTVDMGGATATPDAALFADTAGRDLHLRADASAIDKGAPDAEPGETDVDGDPRVSGAASDLGADEFVNRAPTAALAVSDREPRTNRPVTFDASASRDPDPGGRIASYRWNLGDRTTFVTRGPQTDHVFRRTGEYTATVTVTDLQGATASSLPVTVAVRDGVPPVVRIRSPRYGQGFPYGRRLTFSGTADDAAGVESVRLALRLVQRTARSLASQSPRCRWWDGRRAFRAAPCDTPRFFAARRSGRRWSHRMPARPRLARGVYELSAQAVDATGLANTVFARQFRTLVRFRVR